MDLPRTVLSFRGKNQRKRVQIRNLGRYKYDLDNGMTNISDVLKTLYIRHRYVNIIVEIAFFNGMYDDRWMMQPLYHTNNLQGVGKGDFQAFYNHGRSGSWQVIRSHMLRRLPLSFSGLTISFTISPMNLKCSIMNRVTGTVPCLMP